VINGPLGIVRLAINLYKNLVQMPLPVRVSMHPTDTLLADLGGEQRTEPIPPKPGAFVTHIHTTFMEKVFGNPPIFNGVRL